MMKEEAISSSADPRLRPNSSSPPPTPARPTSSVGASSYAVPTNIGSTDGVAQEQGSKAGSLSRIGSHPSQTSLSTSAGGSALGSSQPSCRPWERGDLLRRLSTFKPTAWFGKPKAANSLACARRGWINVDADKIECESCGANLMFICSAVWTLSEADSAGEEFGKKLDEGHKVTCPWRGNSCAESLVQFPPTPPSALIGGYRDRCDGLFQFPSLPVVAASAVEHMQVSRGSEIDRFLAQPHVFGGVEHVFRPEVISGVENTSENVFFIYSRAQKLISLCGWEPRWLRNVQDCEEHSAQSARNGYSTGPTKHHDLVRGKKVLPISNKKDSSKIEVLGPKSKGESRLPLLDCSLCGATVRIWDFLIVSRPACFAPNSIDIPETSKKMALTRGVSAASGIGGWVASDGMEKDKTEGHDEAATDERRSLSNNAVDLNLAMAGGVSSSKLHRDVPNQFPNVHKSHVKSRSLPLNTLIDILKQQTGKNDIDVGNVRPTLFDVFGEDASPKVKKFMNVIINKLQSGQGTEGGGGFLGMVGGLAMEFLKTKLENDENYVKPALETPVGSKQDAYAGPSQKDFPDNGILISGCQTDQTSADATPNNNPQESYGALSNAIQTILKNSDGSVSNQDLVLKAREMLKTQGFSQRPGLYCSDSHVDSSFVC